MLPVSFAGEITLETLTTPRRVSVAISYFTGSWKFMSYSFFVLPGTGDTVAEGSPVSSMASTVMLLRAAGSPSAPSQFSTTAQGPPSSASYGTEPLT